MILKISHLHYSGHLWILNKLHQLNIQLIFIQTSTKLTFHFFAIYIKFDKTQSFEKSIFLLKQNFMKLGTRLTEN